MPKDFQKLMLNRMHAFKSCDFPVYEFMHVSEYCRAIKSNMTIGLPFTYWLRVFSVLVVLRNF